MSDPSSYVIRGGIPGRERLRVLSRIVHESTTRLLDRVGFSSGMTCLDAGCGGGDVTLELARRVGPDGKVLGIDMDATKDRSGSRVSRGGRANRTRAVRVRRQSCLGCRDPANRAGVGQDCLRSCLVTARCCWPVRYRRAAPAKAGGPSWLPSRHSTQTC